MSSRGPFQPKTFYDSMILHPPERGPQPQQGSRTSISSPRCRLQLQLSWQVSNNSSPSRRRSVRIGPDQSCISEYLHIPINIFNGRLPNASHINGKHEQLAEGAWQCCRRWMGRCCGTGIRFRNPLTHLPSSSGISTEISLLPVSFKTPPPRSWVPKAPVDLRCPGVCWSWRTPRWLMAQQHAAAGARARHTALVPAAQLTSAPREPRHDRLLRALGTSCCPGDQASAARCPSPGASSCPALPPSAGSSGLLSQACGDAATAQRAPKHRKPVLGLAYPTEASAGTSASGDVTQRRSAGLLCYYGDGRNK